MRAAAVRTLERALLRLLMGVTVAVVERRIRGALSRRTLAAAGPSPES
jgi:hypothetical protein